MVGDFMSEGFDLGDFATGLCGAPKARKPNIRTGNRRPSPQFASEFPGIAGTVVHGSAPLVDWEGHASRHRPCRDDDGV